MKKLLLTFLVFTLALVSSPLFAANEDLKITTYYPSPEGEYNKLKVDQELVVAYGSPSPGNILEAADNTGKARWKALGLCPSGQTLRGYDSSGNMVCETAGGGVMGGFSRYQYQIGYADYSGCVAVWGRVNTSNVSTSKSYSTGVQTCSCESGLQEHFITQGSMMGPGGPHTQVPYTTQVYLCSTN